VLDPGQTFDPESSISITRAVKCFLAVEEQPLPLKNVASFAHYFLKQNLSVVTGGTGRTCNRFLDLASFMLGLSMGRVSTHQVPE